MDQDLIYVTLTVTLTIDQQDQKSEFNIGSMQGEYLYKFHHVIPHVFKVIDQTLLIFDLDCDLDL